MLVRSLGATSLQVSALGFGTGRIGDLALDDAEVGRLLNGALDAGITLIDSARSYGAAEERIGRHLAHRRREFVLSTKVGYGIPGFADWTGPCITAGIDAALGRLRTDWIDVVHLHSCPLDVLTGGEVIAALRAAIAAGKVRAAAYSGDNEPLDWAVASGQFESVQTSLNVFEQRVLKRGLAAARQQGLGVIAKRPLANAPWRFADRPAGDYCETYWLRMREMERELKGLDWQDVALRFAAFLPGVTSCIVGTQSLAHLRQSVALVEKGALAEQVCHWIQQAFTLHDQDWIGQV